MRKYIINNKIVDEVLTTQKPLTTASYTCIRSTTDKEYIISNSTSSSTMYTTTSWESRMSTYQRVTTAKSYNESVQYTLTKQITSTRMESHTVTVSCCGNYHCNCYETNLLTGGVETISTTTKQYDRYKEYETITSKVTSSSTFEETLEKTSYKTCINNKSIIKSWIYSTSKINPENKEELCSEYNTKEIEYSYTGNSLESISYTSNKTSSYTESSESSYSYLTSSTQNITSEKEIIASRTFMVTQQMSMSDSSIPVVRVVSSSSNESTIITETIVIPDYYTESSSISTIITKGEEYSINSTKLDFVIDTITESKTLKSFYTTQKDYVSSYWTTSSTIVDTIIHNTTYEKITTKCCVHDTHCKCKCDK